METIITKDNILEILDFLASDNDLRTWALKQLMKDREDKNDPGSADRKKFQEQAMQDIIKLAKEF